MTEVNKEMVELANTFGKVIIASITALAKDLSKNNISYTVIVKSHKEFQLEVAVDEFKYLSPVFNIFESIHADHRKTISDNIEIWLDSFARFIVYDIHKQMNNGAIHES